MKLLKVQFLTSDHSDRPNMRLTYNAPFEDYGVTYDSVNVYVEFILDEDDRVAGKISVSIPEDEFPTELRPALLDEIRSQMAPLFDFNPEMVQWEQKFAGPMQHLMEAERLFRVEAEKQPDAALKRAAIEDADIVARVIQVIENGEHH